MRFKQLVLTVALTLAPLTITQATSAQDIPREYPAYEGYGIYDAGNPNHLGGGIYHKTKRSEIVKLIESISKTNWIALDKLVHNTILTTTELSTLENDTPVKNGNDLFTIRTKKLIELGYYKQSYKLYSTIKDTVINPETSKSGVLSMLYNNQRGKACLEVKIALPTYPEDNFWKQLNAYCTLSHSDEENEDSRTEINKIDSDIIKTLLQNKSFKIPYSQETLSSYSTLELAIIAAQNAIDISAISYTDYDDIAAKHLQIILLNPALSDENKIILSGYAALNNSIPPSELDDLLNELKEKHTKKERTGILNIITLYDETQNALLSSTKQKRINEAFDIADKYGDGILIPFLPYIAEIDADDLNTDQLKRALNLMIIADSDIPENWLNDLNKTKSEKDLKKSQVIFALLTLSESVDKDDEKASQKHINAYLASNKMASALHFIIENIDSKKNNSNKIFNIYENGFDLNAKKSYTMPPVVIINELQRSSKNQNIAQTILLASIITKTSSGQNLNYELLRHAVNALVEVGFEKQARKILAQAILEIEQL